MSQREKDVLEFAPTSGPLRVDREQGIIYGAKIVGLVSGNGQRYRPEALQRAKPLYEGAKVNINHPSRLRPGDDRKAEDRFGKLKNVRDAEDGLYADVHYLKSHPMANRVADAAENPELSDVFGFSQNARVTESLENGQVVYESITRVRSVDLVADPATTRGIFESLEVEPIMDPVTTPEAAPATSTDMTLQMFLDKATEIFNGEGDPASKAKQIGALAKTLLKVSDDIQQAVTGSQTADATSDSSAEEEATVTESRNEAAVLRRENERLRRREKARDVLESQGIPADNARITALAALDNDADQKALIGTWQGKGGTAAKPRSVPASTNVMESQQTTTAQQQGKWDDPKQAAAALLGR